LKKYTHKANYLSPQMCKTSSSNILYFGIHKNNKRLDLSMYISNQQILADFVIFMYPTIQRILYKKNACLQVTSLTMFRSIFLILWNLKNMIFNFLKQ
jgi:hypothetical protein